MVWRSIFKKTDESAEPAKAESPRVAAPSNRSVPPHLEQAIARRTPDGAPRGDMSPEERKLAGLRRQRVAILFDIEQGELAASPDNPWTSRIALLSDALRSVTEDIQATSIVTPGPFYPLPAMPIRIENVTSGDVASVTFSVADQTFTFSEDQDWAERGHQMIRTELIQRSGDPAALVPADVPDELRGPLREHLAESLFVFASDLRDRQLDNEPLPESPTLADLAQPCPICGGWMDWRGTCQACARRNADIAALKREEARLLDERIREADERHRLVEGLPLARKRLRDVESDLARMGETFD